MSDDRRYHTSYEHNDSHVEQQHRRGYAVAESREYARHDTDGDWHGRRRDEGRHRRGSHAHRKETSFDDDRYRDERCQEHYRERDDLKCVECSTWNYAEDVECYRCGRPLREHEADGTAEQVDEFGRVVKKKNKKLPKWPPCFEENGSKYVFDGRSGMFYETNSDFFYDPNSKLYYGNKQQTYYRFNDTTKKYDEVEKTEGAVNDDVAQPVEASKSKASGTKITIKLKTKSIGKGRKAATLAVKKPPPEPKVFKKHDVDISKWSERQAEKRDEGEQSKKKVPKTAKGEPICLICRRKFPTLVKLEYHEKVSKLHQENLVQFQKSQPQYIDRAKLRRDIQGPTSSQPEPAPQTLPTLAGNEPSQPVVQQDTLGDHNIGNQMLRKLGWKPEERKNVMDKDWERIETMASQGRSTTGQSGVGK